MSLATMRMHRAMIRLAKGMIRAWEEWVDSHVIQDPDPAKFFESDKK